MSDIRRPKEHEQMLYDLCQSDRRIFLSYKDALVFAACLGFSSRRTGEVVKTSEPVGLHIFKGEFDGTIFHSLLLLEKHDPESMSDDCQQQRIECFESYAAGGLELLRLRVYESGQDWETALVQLVMESEEGQHTIIDDLLNE